MNRRGGEAREAQPRPGRAGGVGGLLFALSLGALLARVAAQALSPGALGLFDFAVYVGLALSVALAYRGFVRRALIARRRERARRADAAEGGPDAQ